MYRDSHGEKPGKATHKNVSAGGCDTTTADTKDATQTSAPEARIKQALIRFSEWLAVIFRGMV